jgi:hypothetical protein
MKKPDEFNPKKDVGTSKRKTGAVTTETVQLSLTSQKCEDHPNFLFLANLQT